jgi:hypothetical protein
MATRFWHGTAIKRHFSSWGRPRPSKLERPHVHVRAQTHAPTHSHGMDAWVEGEARHSDYPDVSTYDRPATTRMTTANLGLSIVLLVSALVAVGVVLWTVFR